MLGNYSISNIYTNLLFLQSDAFKLIIQTHEVCSTGSIQKSWEMCSKSKNEVHCNHLLIRQLIPFNAPDLGTIPRIWYRHTSLAPHFPGTLALLLIQLFAPAMVRSLALCTPWIPSYLPCTILPWNATPWVNPDVHLVYACVPSLSLSRTLLNCPHFKPWSQTSGEPPALPRLTLRTFISLLTYFHRPPSCIISLFNCHTRHRSLLIG